MNETLKEIHRKRIVSSAKMYRDDLEAMPESQLSQSIGGKARRPYDFTFEVAFVNNNMAAMMLGKEQQKFELGDWVKAPEELCQKQAILDFYNSSVEKVLATIDSLSDEQFATPFEVNGESKSYISIANLVCLHAYYHCGQLNYLQAANGDEEVHWK